MVWIGDIVAKRYIGICVILLSLRIDASADRIYGYVDKIQDNRFSIRTKYFPVAWFNVSSSTAFLCSKAAVPFSAMHVSDPVEVQFRSAQQDWNAIRVSIRGKKADCSTRPRL